MKEFILKVNLIDPKKCIGCRAIDSVDRPDAGCYDICRLTRKVMKVNDRPEWCPLVPHDIGYCSWVLEKKPYWEHKF